MIKKILGITALVAVIGLLVFGAVNRTLAKSGDEAAAERQGSGYGNGSRGQGSGVSVSNPSGELANLPSVNGDLSDEEAAGLLYMREEEKLAHDVYVTLYEEWGLPVFQNISGSEQTHTDAIKTLLDRYELIDPASSQVGVFSDTDLQALYTTLIDQGSQSLADALKVGAAIEEIDILDLQERLAQTDNADIQQVYNNLLKGSSSHLRAFASTLKTQTGETYQPQYLSQAAYDAILSTPSGNGNRGNNGQGGNGGGRGGRP